MILTIEQIVVGADDAGEHADHRKRVEAGLDGGEEHVEFGEEAGERRNAGEREQQHREEERHRRLVRASPARSEIFSTMPPSRRIARMQAKAPSVIVT